MPTQKHTSDNLLIPIPTPDTVEIVAMAVIHQMLTTYNYICQTFYPMIDHVEAFFQKMLNKNVNSAMHLPEL